MPSTEDTCPICFEELLGHRIYVEVDCQPIKHYFHKVCLMRWLGNNDSCPICRQEINQGTLRSFNYPVIRNPVSISIPMEIFLRYRYTDDVWRYKDNVRACIIGLQRDGKLLKEIPREFITPFLCRLAVRNNMWALKYVPEEYRDLELYLAMIRGNPFGITKVPKEFRTYQLCYETVKSNGSFINYVPVEHLTQELCLSAFKSDPEAVWDIPVDLLTPEMNDYMLVRRYEFPRF